MKIKSALLALVDAVRRARLEIACYRDPNCRGTAEGTVERLSKILGNEDINAAMALIDPDAESPSIIPQHDDQRQSVERQALMPSLPAIFTVSTISSNRRVIEEVR